MKAISEREIIGRIRFENPWWGDPGGIDEYFRKMKPRAYLETFFSLISQTTVHRAAVLMGPRRVGKTVMLYHTIQKLIDSGVEPEKICYISIESPVYVDQGLEKLSSYFLEASGRESLEGCFLFFDEIQYLKGWEIHLKRLVEDRRHTRFIASGSAAAALKLKSAESGAGRFTDFFLPPLTFYEYLDLLDKRTLIREETSARDDEVVTFDPVDIDVLNREFVNYLNFGGYPEAIFSEEIKANPYRYIRSDIVDKVLLRDLPGIYGIQDIQELNRLFTMLAYNTGNEVSLDELSRNSGVAKNTIKKYIEYLEAAFLITIFHRVDQSGRRFKKANYFKAYLTNPSIRAALFGPVAEDDELMGNLTETAIIGQWQHSDDMRRLYYSRWDGGEVDLVYLSEAGRPEWCVEVKWSNRYYESPSELKSLIKFVQKNSLTEHPLVTTIDKRGRKTTSGIVLEFEESSIYCYTIGRNSIRRKDIAKRRHAPGAP